MRRLLSVMAASLPLVMAPLLAPLTMPLAPAHAADPVRTPAFTPEWDNGPGGERLVAFGDSFAAGPLVLPARTSSGGCMRSANNYASLLADHLSVNAFTDASCISATTEDFWAPQNALGTINPPQLNALSSDTTIVTFGTMGGNDIGLVGLALDCLLKNCLPPAGTDPFAGAFTQLSASLGAALDETKRRAPNAVVVVVGYGTYLPKNGCPTKILGLSAAEANHLQRQIDRLSDTLEAVAADKGVTFADMREIPGAADHTACAAPAQQWIRAVNTHGDGAPLHPSIHGMRAWGDHLTGVTLKALGERDGVDVGDLTPAQAQRLADLKAKGMTAWFSVTCLGLGDAKVLTQQVTGGRGAISKIGWWVGDHKLGIDQTAPYLRSDWAKDVKKHPGDLRAVIHVNDGGLRWVRHIDVKRPACLG